MLVLAMEFSKSAKKAGPGGRPRGITRRCSRKTEQRCPTRASHHQERRTPTTGDADERAE
jgi:hypothetical protein